jgi:hypothetical protein
MSQKKLDIIPDNPLEEIHAQLSWIREGIAALRTRVKNQGAMLRELAALLGEMHTELFEMQQGELFGEGEADDFYGEGDTECKNEVFEELRDLLGAEQAEKVADYFSGSQVYFSKNVAIARRHREIRKAFREGATYRDLGAQYGYTEAHIRNIVHGGKSK